MKPNDARLLRALLAAGDGGVLESRFPFAAQKRLQEQGLIRYRPDPAATEALAPAALRPLILTPAGHKMATGLPVLEPHH